jgi:hypothetical protein
MVPTELSWSHPSLKATERLMVEQLKGLRVSVPSGKVQKVRALPVGEVRFGCVEVAFRGQPAKVLNHGFHGMSFQKLKFSATSPFRANCLFQRGLPVFFVVRSCED